MCAIHSTWFGVAHDVFVYVWQSIEHCIIEYTDAPVLPCGCGIL